MSYTDIDYQIRIQTEALKQDEAALALVTCARNHAYKSQQIAKRKADIAVLERWKAAQEPIRAGMPQ